MSVEEVRQVLDDLLNGPEPDWTADPAWALLEDERAMSRKARRFLALQAKIEAVAKLFADEIEELAQRRTAVLRPMLNDLDHLREALRLWHQGRLAENPRAITIHLPGGTLASQEAQDKWDWDDGLFAKWADENLPNVLVPQPAKVNHAEARKALNVKAVKGQAITPDGEVVPGLTITKGGDDQSGRHFRIKGGPK